MIFRKFCTKSTLSEIWTKYEIIKIFDKTRDDFRKFWQKSRFSKIVAKIKIFRNFWPLLRLQIFFSETDIFENFDQKRGVFFSKIMIKIRILEILTKIENLVNFKQNRDFREKNKKWRFSYKILTNIKISNRFDKISIFSKIVARMEVFRKNFITMTIFENLAPKSRFSENLDPKTKYRDYRKFRSNSGFVRF